jgi:hypothetical protein
MKGATLIHHQGIICCVAFDRSALRRIFHTPQASLLGALHLTPCWCPGILPNPLILIPIPKFDGGFGGNFTLAGTEWACSETGLGKSQAGSDCACGRDGRRAMHGHVLYGRSLPRGPYFTSHVSTASRPLHERCQDAPAVRPVGAAGSARKICDCPVSLRIGSGH